MDGFGFALNGGSAMHLFNMNRSSRLALLNELFGNNENSIRTSYLRISIGASDLDEYPFSYNDLPAGETDIGMDNFDLGYDLSLIHISEPTRLRRISYAVFCLKKK